MDPYFGHPRSAPFPYGPGVPSAAMYGFKQHQGAPADIKYQLKEYRRQEQQQNIARKTVIETDFYWAEQKRLLESSNPEKVEDKTAGPATIADKQAEDAQFPQPTSNSFETDSTMGSSTNSSFNVSNSKTSEQIDDLGLSPLLSTMTLQPSSSPLGAPVNEDELFGGQSLAGLNFDKYHNIPVERSGPNIQDIPVLESFADLTDKIPPFLSRNIDLCKYVVPTPVQKHAIPLAMAGRDVMCCAQTGSGKTCAFLLPCISCLASSSQGAEAGVRGGPCSPRLLVLAPTRELASQIFLEAQKLANRSDLRLAEVYGGVDAKPQLRALCVGVDVVVATPGRLLDFIDRGVVSMKLVTHLVLDEADRMLDMGFEPQIRDIVTNKDMAPSGARQTLMFSATFPPEIQKLAGDFLRDYVWVGVGRVGSTTENISQRVMRCESAMDKPRVVVELIEEFEGRTLVFVEKKRTAAWLHLHLKSCNIEAQSIHGDRTQAEREAALAEFRKGTIRVLVATDVAARGLDVPSCVHVINYDLPSTIDDYVHRIGRTGRAGHTGFATAIFVPTDPRNPTSNNNNHIAPDLLRLLKENKAPVPAWFASEVAAMTSSPNPHTARDFAPYGNRGSSSFVGGRDVRRASAPGMMQFVSHHNVAPLYAPYYPHPAGFYAPSAMKQHGSNSLPAAVGYSTVNTIVDEGDDSSPDHSYAPHPYHQQQHQHQQGGYPMAPPVWPVAYGYAPSSTVPFYPPMFVFPAPPSAYPYHTPPQYGMGGHHGPQHSSPPQPHAAPASSATYMLPIHPSHPPLHSSPNRADGSPQSPQAPSPPAPQPGARRNIRQQLSSDSSSLNALVED